MDIPRLLLLLLLQLVLILLNAYFAGTEIALLSVSDIRLKALADEGDKRAKKLLKLTLKPEKFLSTIQIAITLSGFLGSALAADNFSEPLHAWLLTLGLKVPETVLVIVITLILSFFTLVFGELVPKRIAMKYAEKMALGMAIMVLVMMGPRQLGRMWRKIKVRSFTPRTRAARTYSRPLKR